MPESSAYPPRPQLLRGNTVPLYVRTVSSSSCQDHALQNGGDPQPSSARPDQSYAPGQRKQPGSSFSGSMQSSRMPQGFNLPPTPPLSTSPGSAESSNNEDAYFPAAPGGRQQSPYALNSFRSAKSSGGYASSLLSPVTSPTVTSHPTSFQMLRSTRAPQNKSAPMRIENTSMAYILSAVIGPGFDSSCITIAMRKNNYLDIVADRWDQEKDCHHEWQIQFDRDADMNGVHAGYADGVLTVTVKRLSQSSSRPPQMRP